MNHIVSIKLLEGSVHTWAPCKSPSPKWLTESSLWQPPPNCQRGLCMCYHFLQIRIEACETGDKCYLWGGGTSASLQFLPGSVLCWGVQCGPEAPSASWLDNGNPSRAIRHHATAEFCHSKSLPVQMPSEHRKKTLHLSSGPHLPAQQQKNFLFHSDRRFSWITSKKKGKSRKPQGRLSPVHILLLRILIKQRGND